MEDTTARWGSVMVDVGSVRYRAECGTYTPSFPPVGRLWVQLLFDDEFISTYNISEGRSIKAGETSPQHPSVKKERENLDMNDYEEEGDLEEEEIKSRGREEDDDEEEEGEQEEGEDDGDSTNGDLS
ncbi:hypothetical protein NFI96_002757 [Prochilodus magdalenae]|nr:hypothetical protein NFI96_002757 [Prochilodus magdalenae]